MQKKVLIANRGVIALDIIDSLKSLGLETILLYSPEDASSLPVKMADRSYKFFSSRLEDSYEDMEAIIDKALELKVDYIHPGYGFLSENADFAEMCEENKIKFIGPESRILKIVRDKIELRKIAEKMGISVLPYSEIFRRSFSVDSLPSDFSFPLLIKPLTASGGKGMRLVESKKDAQEHIDKMLKLEHHKQYGLYIEPFLGHGHHIEIPFIRDIRGNILFPPEIESSLQRRFQKIFQESPSINVSDSLRQSMYHDAQKLVEELDYVGLGYVEFIVEKDKDHAYFLEINPSFQINTLITEVHLISNFLKKHFAICNGEELHNVNGVKILEPQQHVLLLSLMAENPFEGFRPSAGTVSEFYSYSTIRNIFKTYLYPGAKVSSLYDPYIGKIVTSSSRRDHSINSMRHFLDNIIIKGIKTNLVFLRHLLYSDCLAEGDTNIDFLKSKCEFAVRKKSDEEIAIATALLSAAFHIENRKNNYRFKEKLQRMKQPGFFARLFNRM